MSSEKSPLSQNKKELEAAVKIYETALRDTSCQLEEKIRELSLLRRIVNISVNVFELDLFYRDIVDIILQETRAMNCSFMAADPGSETLYLKTARGRDDSGTYYDIPVPGQRSFTLGEGVSGTAAAQREVILIKDAASDRRFAKWDTEVEVGSLLSAPLVFRDALLGVVNLSHPLSGVFTENSKRLIEIICGIIGPMLGNARMHLETQRRFRSMFEGVPFSIIIIDPDSREIIDCNRFSETCFGYTKQEMMHVKDACDLVHPDYRSRLRKMLTVEHDDNDNLNYVEIPCLLKNGSVKICEANSDIINFMDRRVSRLILVDVSEKKRLTEQLFQSEKLRSLGELAGGVAHDFNNILAAILGRIQLIRMHFTDERLQEAHKDIQGVNITHDLDIIEQAAADGTETVRRIQEFAGSSEHKAEPVLIDVNEIIRDAFEFTRVKWKDMAEADGRTITVETDFSTLEPVSGIASELREVLVNLINNSVDALPAGGSITVETLMRDGYAEIFFRDSGVGIPREIRDKIFDPFFTTKEIGSTGLGLSVSYGIIRRYGGAIEVCGNHEGPGSCFHILLPASHDRPVKKPQPADIVKHNKTSVLLIEDDQCVADTVHDLLTFSGNAVSVFANGEDGIESFRNGHYDAVITDLGMPGISGYDVAKNIKSISPKTPVILITGWKLEITGQQLKDHGIDFLLNKPFQAGELLRILNSLPTY